MEFAIGNYFWISESFLCMTQNPQNAKKKKIKVVAWAALSTKTLEWKWVWSHWVQLHKKKGKWHAKGVVRPNPERQEAAQGAESGPECPARAAGWGLDSQELNAGDSVQPGRSPPRWGCPPPTCRITGSVCRSVRPGSWAHSSRGKKDTLKKGPFWTSIRDHLIRLVPSALIHWNQPAEQKD